MEITEVPERWVVVSIPDGHFKVIGTWAESYLSGDRWRINSGVVDVHHDDDYYYFVGHSGSCYRCHKKAYGFASSYGENIVEMIIMLGEGKIKLLEDRDNWNELKQDNDEV